MKEPCSVCGDLFAPNSYKQKRCDPCRFKKAIKRVRNHPKTHATYTRAHPESIQWRVVPGYEGRYEISSQGDVISMAKGSRRVLHPRKYDDGYRVALSDRFGRVRYWRLNRLMLTTFAPVDHPETYITECINDDCFDMTLSNWRWVKPVGQYASRSKLTDYDVRTIKQRLMADSALSYTAIGKEYRVSAAAIGRIMTGQTWKHVV